jgi:hypothetical protein
MRKAGSAAAPVIEPLLKATVVPAGELVRGVVDTGAEGLEDFGTYVKENPEVAVAVLAVAGATWLVYAAEYEVTLGVVCESVFVPIAAYSVKQDGSDRPPERVRSPAVADSGEGKKVPSDGRSESDLARSASRTTSAGEDVVRRALELIHENSFESWNGQLPPSQTPQEKALLEAIVVLNDFVQAGESLDRPARGVYDESKKQIAEDTLDDGLEKVAEEILKKLGFPRLVPVVGPAMDFVSSEDLDDPERRLGLAEAKKDRVRIQNELRKYLDARSAPQG